VLREKIQTKWGIAELFIYNKTHVMFSSSQANLNVPGQERRGLFINGVEYTMDIRLTKGEDGVWREDTGHTWIKRAGGLGPLLDDVSKWLNAHPEILAQAHISEASEKIESIKSEIASVQEKIDELKSQLALAQHELEVRQKS
jgi:hypothetical protein